MGEAVTKWLQVNDMDSTGRYVLSANFVPPPDGPVSIAILWDNGAPRLLPIPEDQFNAVAVNAHGVVTGYGSVGDGPGDLWVYDGTLTRLPLPAGFTNGVPLAISDQGVTSSELLDLLQKKAKGKPLPEPAEEEGGDVVDLMEALRQSVEATKTKRKPARKRKAS